MSNMQMILGEGTKGRILEELLLESKTTKELAELLKIRESAIRMHLERMVEMGVLTSSFHREGVGRPKKQFFLTSSGHDLFAKRYDLVLDSLVNTLIEKEGEAYVRSLFATLGKKMADSIGAEIQWAGREKSIESKSQTLVRVMNNLGQKAEIVRENGGINIVSHNCLFRSLAMKYPGLFCDLLHKNFVEKTLAPHKVEFKESLAKGSKSCVFALRAQ